MKISIVGLGFVGLSFASVLGSRGFSVIGIDSDKKKVLHINEGRPPFFEPKLSSFLSSALRKSLKVTSDINEIIETDLIFITVGTPQTKNGRMDLTNVKAVTREIGKVLTNMNNKPVVVVKSTVVPGTTTNLVRPILERYSNRKAGEDFDVVSNPEFLREGKAIDDTINPHIVVIGVDDKQFVKKIKKFYDSLYGSKVQHIITNPQTAEMIKYANNSFLATKISFINQIANICQSIPGTNVEEVASAIGLDPRIGNLFLKAGPGFGGSCLPKDLKALIGFSSGVGVNPLLLKAVDEVNALQLRTVFFIIKRALKKVKRKKITILGLSFKEDSDDIRESVSIKLIKSLLKEEADITVHDPRSLDNTRKIFGNSICYAKSVRDALKNSQCLVLMTPWHDYSKLTNNDLKLMKRRVVVDTRRILSPKLKAEYYAVGIGKET
jgi:UDPglucose 6-dehydrogenase